MKKEEFLAFSLPYGLIVADKCTNENLLFAGLNLDSCELLLYSYIYGSVNENIGEYGINMFDPVLHPMHDLTKTIEHNGEKFIPIIELAKISFDVYDNLKIKVKSEDKISGCIFLDEDNDVIVFVYHYETQSFCAHQHSNKEFLNVHYQLKMIQKLIEWKFDIAGLIEKGEAIDVNTLEINPYK